MENKTICGLDATEIEALKEKHGALVLVEIELDKKTYEVIFKEPTMLELGAIEKISKTAPHKALEAAYINHKIAADQEIEKRDILKIKAVETLITRIQKVSGEAKNL